MSTNFQRDCEPHKYDPDTQRPAKITPKIFERTFGRSTSRAYRYRKNDQTINKLIQRIKNKREANEKILKEKHLQSIVKMAPPKNYIGQISKAIIETGRKGLRICSIDMDYTRIRMKNGSILPVPLWIAIIDGSFRVVYHQFIRHPTSALVESQFGTRWHGLTRKDVNNGKGFYRVRAEVIHLLRYYDRIIVSGQTRDFASLFLPIEVHRKLLPQIVCISSYYNCRSKNNQFGLKYAAFLMFNVILQGGTHSPLVDAAFILYLYLIDFEQIEKIKCQLDTTKVNVQGYHEYIYPKNIQMASLLRKTMDYIGDWPDSIKCGPFEKSQRRTKRKYFSSDYIESTCDDQLVPSPYIFDEIRKKSLTSYRRVNPRLRSRIFYGCRKFTK